uniref:helicase C-terminal domain-containing protein n=1 Tax=Sulfurimonas sp. TaxID=2022749 RepID=UPI00345C262E
AFRQSIGRLIRDPEDRGDIYILDSKLKTRPENVEKKVRFFLEKISTKGDEE